MPPPHPAIPPPLIRRPFRLFWCHQCRRPVSIPPSLSATSELFCPRCFGQFVHDLDIPHPPLPPLPPPPPPPPPPPANFHFDFPYPHPHLHLQHLFPPWIPFQPQPIDGHLALPPPPPPPPRSHSVPPTLDPGDYFAGPNLSELIQELAESDHTGPPPAADSSIVALPAVAITPAHLGGGSESECPVCKEEFFVGEEAREMPCRHVYHSDCIVPWLRMHNSCPVCRFELAGTEPSAGQRRSRERSGGGGGGGGRRRQVPERWNPLTMLSALRGSSSRAWDRRHGGDWREQEEDAPMDNAAEKKKHQ